MKTNRIIPALIILAFSIMMSACKTEETPDTIVPEIYFNGDNIVSVFLGSTYTDAGATATDDIDGDISASIITTGTVNTALKGTYYITYTVSDAAGNTATASRTVKVLNTADYLAGGYSLADVVTGNNAGTYYYNVSVYTSDTVNNKLYIRNLSEFGSSVLVEVTLNPADSTLNIATQNPLLMTNPGTITGTGTTNISAITSISYNCAYTGGGSDTGIAACTKL